MRFSGQIRVPEVDHPGVPATFVVDDNQAEVMMEGESLGRWSLFDVRVTRLVSSAFQVEFAGEEITFLADEPVDFAYKGVEHMAEAWARYKTMAMPRRLVSVKRSRRGTIPSRLGEFRQAMVENLRLESSIRPGGDEPAPLAGEAAVASPVVEPATTSDWVADAADEVMPAVGKEEPEAVKETDRLEKERLEAERRDKERLEAEKIAEAERLASERAALAAERTQLEEQKKSLEKALAEAERLEKERLEAAAIDIERIEEEKRALEKRHAEERAATERLQAERLELQELETERLERERQQAEELEETKRVEAERLEEERGELARLEEERVERERLETEKLEAARLELEQQEQERAEAARLEMDRLNKERTELMRLERERLAAEEAERAAEEAERLAAEEAERLAAEEAERAAEEAEKAAEEAEREETAGVAAASEPEEHDDDGVVQELLGTSAEGEVAETSKELVVDLGDFETKEEKAAPTDEPQPALTAVTEKSGIMGAVKAAFTRNGKNHVHDFTEAPGGIGMVRYICRECGFVSISSSD